jgi:hypothetical protein
MPEPGVCHFNLDWQSVALIINPIHCRVESLYLLSILAQANWLCRAQLGTFGKLATVAGGRLGDGISPASTSFHAGVPGQFVDLKTAINQRAHGLSSNAASGNISARYLFSGID